MKVLSLFERRRGSFPSTMTAGICIALATVSTYAAEPEPDAPEAERAKEVASLAASLKNADIEWDAIGFGAGPVIRGDNAKAIIAKGVDHSASLQELLKNPDQFVAAHILLTQLWRVHRLDKDVFSRSVYRGFFVHYNGLNVRIEWHEELGKEIKKVTVPDLECQMKRIRDFWEKRRRDHPREFSAATEVD